MGLARHGGAHRKPWSLRPRPLALAALFALAMAPGVLASSPGITIQARSLSDACASGGAGNGDGVLDPGETVSIAVTALNGYPTVATGVSGTLTSTTPGVTVTASTASFGDLAPGAAASGNQTYGVSLSPALTCGAPLDFLLTFASSMGSSAQAFTLLVGQATSGTATTLLSESFESWPPAGWTLVPDPQTGGVWSSSAHASGCITGSSFPYANGTGGTGLFADANSDCYGDAMDTAMVTPSFSLASPAYVSAQLQFRSDFYCLDDLDDAWVDITTDDGAIWTNLVYFDHQSARGPDTRTIDLTPYLGQANVRLSFEYDSAGWDWYWQVDDVTVTATQSGGCAVNICSALPCTLSCAATAPATGSAGTAVPFSAAATPSGACSGSPSYHWDFGDGQTSTVQNPAHTYAAAGTFPWSVTATQGGASCSKSGTIDVAAPVPPPVVTSIRKVAPPFTLVVAGSNLQAGLALKIDGAPWPELRWKSESKVKVTGGASLKALVPKGAATQLTFVNPDGGETTTTFSW